MWGGPCNPPPRTTEIDIYRYILVQKQYFHQISWQLSRVPLETPQTIWNNHISHRFISLLLDLIPLTKVLTHHYVVDAWTSNACQGHNFHCRDLKYLDIVPDTITIYNYNKKMIKIKLPPIRCPWVRHWLRLLVGVVEDVRVCW